MVANTARKNIAVISSRLKCIDAISVEAEKWIDKYVKLDYNVHLISGKFGEPVELPNLELPEMDYKHPEVRGVKTIIFGTHLGNDGKKAGEILLSSLVNRIKNPLKKYLIKNNIDLISVEDSLLSMKNLPLNVALSGIIKELKMPTISRYHYFPWDNSYFSKNDNLPKITETIPLNEKHIVHITNTESARMKLNEKKKINSKVIPNTIDFDKLAVLDEYNKDFREAFGISKDAFIFLQPTRVKRNKSVEKSIRMLAEINERTKKENVLIITGAPVYQRGNYFEAVVKRIKKYGVNVIFANDRIFLGRHQNPEKKFYSIGDAYVHADVILYPNISDAFGNPVIEACAYKKPVVVSDYPNLKEVMDKGFEFIKITDSVRETISDLYQVLTDEKRRVEMTEKNYALAKEHFSSDILDDNLIPILNAMDGQRPQTGRFTIKIWKWKRRPDGKKQDLKGKKPVTKVRLVVKQRTHVPSNSGSSLVNKKGGYKEPPQKRL